MAYGSQGWGLRTKRYNSYTAYTWRQQVIEVRQREVAVRQTEMCERCRQTTKQVYLTYRLVCNTVAFE